MRPSGEGLKSDNLRAALNAALVGRTAQLEELLCRFGGGPDPRPNLRLAAAFGEEVAALPDARGVWRVLNAFTLDDAAPDDARVFLPMAACYGWVALLAAKRESRSAWSALAELAGDERTPVRKATLDALSGFVGRPSGATALVENARDWLTAEDRDKRFAAAALVVEVLGARKVLGALASHGPLLDYLAAVVAELADAPRSAERLDGRRRLLTSLPPTLAGVVGSASAGDRGATWFEALCRDAVHPDVRKALSDTLLHLRKEELAQSAATIDRLRQSLQGSAKPPRDPTRRRPGQGRGKASRAVK